MSCPGCPSRGKFVHQGAQETNCLAISQLSFPVTFNGLLIYMSLRVSVWAEAFRIYIRFSYSSYSLSDLEILNTFDVRVNKCLNWPVNGGYTCIFFFYS